MPARTIDYLNIDCELADFRVLKGLDLGRYPVRILSIEALDERSELEITSYLKQHDMQFVEKMGPTLLFKQGA